PGHGPGRPGGPLAPEAPAAEAVAPPLRRRVRPVAAVMRSVREGAHGMGLAFLACVERGPLEEQTTLLCRSIRRYGGRFRAAPIYAFQPRAGHDIAPETRRTLEAL